MGDEDAYDRVFDCEHRDIVKEAFNAMIQASTNLTHKPKKLDLSEVDFDWAALKQAILDAHKPIADVFFQGHGNHLQFIDSCTLGGTSKDEVLTITFQFQIKDCRF